jgi:hypothetical protein
MSAMKVWLLFIICLTGASAWSQFLRPRSSNWRLASSKDFMPKPQVANALDRELDVFFETAAKSGSKSVIKLTPAQRAEMTVRGAALEDLIYEARDRLLIMEDQYMRDGGADLAEEISQLRDEINGLKDDYVLLVGAKDLPLYFGRPHQ